MKGPRPDFEYLISEELSYVGSQESGIHSCPVKEKTIKTELYPLGKTY